MVLVALFNPYAGLNGNNYITIDPSQVPLPAQTQTGTPTTIPAGELFPTLTGRIFEQASNLANNLPSELQTQLPTDAVDIQQFLQAYAKIQAATQLGGVADVPAGCAWHIQIWGNHIYQYDPGGGNNFTFGVLYATPQLVADYWAMGLPTVTTEAIGPGNGTNLTPYNPLNLSETVYTNLNAISTVKAYDDTFTVFMFTKVIGYSCNPPYNEETPVSAIPPPAAPTLPAGLALPVVPQTCPPPIIVSGIVTQAPPGNAGGVSFVPNGEGGYVANITLPNCTCSDGVTPQFQIGNVTSDKTKPVSVTLRTIAPNSYALDFNLPTTPFQMVPITCPVNMLDPVSGNETNEAITAYVPSDGTNDFGVALLLVLEQIAELRAKIGLGVAPIAAAPTGVTS